MLIYIVGGTSEDIGGVDGKVHFLTDLIKPSDVSFPLLWTLLEDFC